METRVPLTELQNRLSRFRSRMDSVDPEWQAAVIFGKVNQYYFTGTMQDGLLWIPRAGEAVYWVRKSFERATDESHFPRIEPMNSFREVAAAVGGTPSSLHIECERVPIALLRRFQKHFPVDDIRSLDGAVAAVRAVKSEYELALMEICGEMHRRILEEQVPAMLREGMSEAEFAAQLYPLMVAEGHHGLARFAMFETEMALGNICFGESSLYPSYFDGPGGSYGLHPAVPLLGSRRRKLGKGELVFVDIAFGVEGYHTDKTMTYMFGGPIADEAIAAHRQCVEIQNRIAEQLKPGAIPSAIYQRIMDDLSPEFLHNFMGAGSRPARFLGHGIGLQVDEAPVIAKGFDEPLQEGMVLALEPKKGLDQVGLVGIENTFVVTAEGGRCLTGSHPGLLEVY